MREKEPDKRTDETNHPEVRRTDSHVLPFEDLEAPTAADPTPPLYARWLGATATLVSGLLGGLIGYGTGDLLGETQAWPLGGLVIGAATAGIGVGIIVSLTLRAMNEWDAAQHPEAEEKPLKTSRKDLAKLAARSAEKKATETQPTD